MKAVFARLRRRGPAWLGHAAFAALLVLASYPAWRVALLAPAPTLEELMRLRCSTKSSASAAPARVDLDRRAGA